MRTAISRELAASVSEAGTVRRDARISGESSSGSRVVSEPDSAIKRRISLASCRTLPGHLYSRRCTRASRWRV